MRDGALLAEQSPSSLLAAHNCQYLEDAFLQLCQKQESKMNSQEVILTFYSGNTFQWTQFRFQLECLLYLNCEVE